jgi:hypothetical protein
MIGGHPSSSDASVVNLTNRSKENHNSASKAGSLLGRPIPMPVRLDKLEAFIDNKYGCHSLS